jgi:hypothetical protein
VPLRGSSQYRSEEALPPTKSVVALRSPKRDQGSGRDVETLPVRQAPPQCDAAQPPVSNPRSIYDLKRNLDGHGDEIFIQTECKTTGKPTLWYKLDRHKNRIRYERKTAGITTTRLGKTEMLC